MRHVEDADVRVPTSGEKQLVVGDGEAVHLAVGVAHGPRADSARCFPEPYFMIITRGREDDGGHLYESSVARRLAATLSKGCSRPELVASRAAMSRAAIDASGDDVLTPGPRELEFT